MAQAAWEVSGSPIANALPSGIPNVYHKQPPFPNGQLTAQQTCVGEFQRSCKPGHSYSSQNVAYQLDDTASQFTDLVKLRQMSCTLLALNTQRGKESTDFKISRQFPVNVTCMRDLLLMRMRKRSRQFLNFEILEANLIDS